jgi:uncharacterized membrane protein
LTAEVLDKFAELITVALGLVAALAWNTAIQNLFTMIFGEAGGALIGQFIYAIIITLIVIFATMAVSRAAERAKRLEEQRALYGFRLRKIRYTAATTAGVVMRSTTRRNSAHSHQDSSTLIPFSP